MISDSPEFRDLCVAIAAYYGTDPHLGSPHPETIQAIAFAVASAIEVSKSRPAKYASEPWIGIPVGEHLEHAVAHLSDARIAVDCHGASWLDEDWLPNAAHAILRAAFGLFLHEASK